ncbi:MAG: 23S rRNA (pseudouridine(1915)-N(3))-methyltransferase RlmH [Pseudomonadota bacterium]
MRLIIAAVGRMKAGPERVLFEDYAARIRRAGSGPGLGPLDLQEIDERKFRGPDTQSSALLDRVPASAVRVVLDERGQTVGSPDLARRLRSWADEGRGAVVFLIGGADGHDQHIRDQADLILSFGPMVWPHMLARVMLAEQIYRACTILAGTPYHRT